MDARREVCFMCPKTHACIIDGHNDVSAFSIIRFVSFDFSPFVFLFSFLFHFPLFIPLCSFL